MEMQTTASGFVSIDVLIDPFVADVQLFRYPQGARDLLGTPLLFQKRVHCLPIRGRQSPPLLLLPPRLGQLRRLSRPITTLAPVPLQLARYRARMLAKFLRDLRLPPTGAATCRNLVSLFLGNLFIAHRCSFDLAVKAAAILAQLALTSKFSK